MDEMVSARIDKRITDALNFYTPSSVHGDTAVSARVRYALVAYLQDRGSPIEVPRESHKGSRPHRGPYRPRARRHR
jgi:hypothetical protein